MSPDDLITLATQSAGQKIEEKYHLIRRLGSGQYGVVFLADEVDKDRSIRQVAVKLIPLVASVHNLQEELQISPALQHPHVLQCFTSGQNKLEKKLNLGDGQDQPKQIQYLYLVMELADKDEETLEKYFKKRGNLSEAETWDLLESLVSALVYFSELSPRLVHRDLKPANVLRVGGKWKIADFGIVRLVNQDILSTIHPMGAPAYAPPEFYPGIVSPAFDMWSLGVMIVEMLTGQLPFFATSNQQLQTVVMKAEPKIASLLPSPFPEIVKGCLEKNHQKRLTAEQLEVNFIIPRLVWEVWKPETETEKDQTEKAIQTLKEFRPKLKGKTNAPNIMLRYILKWTRFQDPLLTQLLEWVCDAQSIPVEGEEQWIDKLVCSHIKDWNAQKLSEYLDFDAPANSFWLGLKQKYDNPFALVDDFLARQDFSDLGTIQKISNIIDYYSASISDKNSAEGQTNFQRLISNSLNGKFSEAKKKIDQLLRRYITQGTAQKLAEYLDFDAPANSFWLGLKKKYGNPFALVDDFLAKQNWGDEEKIKKINEIIDEYKLAHYNIDGATKGEVNFQRLISDSLNYKFSEAQKTMAQDQLNQLLTDVVEGATGDLEAIIIFDLDTNCPRFSNSQLKKSNPELDRALFGDEDDEGGEAIEGFDALSTIQEALNQIGEKTKFGNLDYSIFKLESGTIIVDVVELDIPLAICFLAPKKIKLGNVVAQYRKKIVEIKEALRTM